MNGAGLDATYAERSIFLFEEMALLEPTLKRHILDVKRILLTFPEQMGRD